MSNEEDKWNHSKRLADKNKKITKQLRLLKDTWGIENNKRAEQPHRLHKIHAFNCGDPKCYMCGNPRKFDKEVTMQEKSFNQTKNWTEVLDDIN